MPGPEVKDWKVYEDCMKDKEKIPANKEYCAKVANAVAGRTIKHSDLPIIIRYGIEQGVADATAAANEGGD
jgi:hypothetical protein